MKLSALELAWLRDKAARLRLSAEGVNLDRLPSERDFLVPMRTNLHGSERRYQQERAAGEIPCPACRDAHSRFNNPSAPVPSDFAEEQWGGYP